MRSKPAAAGRYMQHDKPKKNTVLRLSEAEFRRRQKECDEQENALLALMQATAQEPHGQG